MTSQTQQLVTSTKQIKANDKIAFILLRILKDFLENTIKS